MIIVDDERRSVKKVTIEEGYRVGAKGGDCPKWGRSNGKN